MTRNPFQTLGLPERFDLEPAAVERAYLARISALHPDLSGAGDADPDEQDRLAAALNDAKAELLDAERRAEALLALRGGPGKADDKTLPPGFLMEILKVREEMEAELAADAEAARTKWAAWSAGRRAAHAAELAPLFAAAATPEVLKQIRRVLNQWRYTERLVERLQGHESV